MLMEIDNVVFCLDCAFPIRFIVPSSSVRFQAAIGEPLNTDGSRMMDVVLDFFGCGLDVRHSDVGPAARMG